MLAHVRGRGLRCCGKPRWVAFGRGWSCPGRRPRPKESALNLAHSINAYLLVALGSGIGGAARLFVSTLVARFAGTTFPWGTLAVNVLGCLVVGILAAMFEPASPLHLRQDLRVFLVVGVLGGFTTFSAFSLETLLLLQRGATLAAASYAVLSMALGLLAAAAAYVTMSGALR